MIIEVLGTGCPKCRQLTRAAEEAVRELGLDAAVVKVTDLEQILARGVSLTPALAVNGEVKVAGKVPRPAEIRDILAAAQDA